MSRRRRKRGIALPWEQRGAWLRDLLAGRRWKMLLVAVAIVGVVGLIWRSTGRRERIRATRLTISQVRRAISAFRMQTGRCPLSIEELVHPPDPGQQYLRELPKDAWGRPLWVKCPSPQDPADAEVVSAGPSGSFFKDDNVQ